MDDVSYRGQKKKAENENIDSEELEPIDWGKEFAVFAAVFGWTPDVVSRLTLQQFEAYQAFAYEYLAKSEISGGVANIYGLRDMPDTQKIKSSSQISSDNFDAIEAAAKRLKKRKYGNIKEKVKFPLEEVLEEMKRG